MATTSIWPVRGYLSNLVIYVENPEKTEPSKAVASPSAPSAGAQSLDDVISYAMAANKTVDTESSQSVRCYVTGINCTPTGVRDQMMRTKARFGKDGGIVAYHGYQSFKPGEVTPDIAHEIGVKLASRLWAERFEVIVATHLDRGHIHNHLLVNSVSFADGLRFRSNKTTYGQLRAESDRICLEHGLSVIEQPQQGNAKQYGEWRAEKEGKLSWKAAIKADIDYALKRSVTPESFVKKLVKMGYEVKWHENRELSVKAPGRERFLRPVRHFGREYSLEELTHRLQENYRYGVRAKPRLGLHPKINRRIRERLQNRNPHSLATRYCRYYLLLVECAKLPPSDMSPSLRAETAALEFILRQVLLLLENCIDTIGELIRFKKAQEQKLNPLQKERAKLYKVVAKSDDTGKVAEAKERLRDIKFELKTIRTTIRDCDLIEEQAPNLDRRTKQLMSNGKDDRLR
jgi:hypothetical protein